MLGRETSGGRKGALVGAKGGVERALLVALAEGERGASPGETSDGEVEAKDAPLDPAARRLPALYTA